MKQLARALRRLADQIDTPNSHPSWQDKLVAGFAGARPALPNMTPARPRWLARLVNRLIDRVAVRLHASMQRQKLVPGPSQGPRVPVNITVNNNGKPGRGDLDQHLQALVNASKGAARREMGR